MTPRIDLVWLGEGRPPDWRLGSVRAVAASSSAVADLTEREAPSAPAKLWLFWNPRLGVPDPERVATLAGRPEDVWHAGLALGMGGLPSVVDFIAPTWMLNRDCDPRIESTSWRVSFEACLVHVEVLRAMGPVRREFESLAAAALEFGHRCVTRGVILRHVPDLAGSPPPRPAPAVSREDELRFAFYRFGRPWARWATFRGLLRGRWGLFSGLGALRRVSRSTAPVPPAPFRRPTSAAAPDREGSVTVLIPTLRRYAYLRRLLDQLRRQTRPPLEIVVVDQTEVADRADIAAEFPDLPLRVFYRDEAGQCSSRNQGIEESRGEFVLLLDDDVEVPPDLIEKHLEAMRGFPGAVSSGVAEEDGAGDLPEDFRIRRVSDVFPAGNSLVSRAALAESGLFDLAYERGARADADLGMRLYLAGRLLLLSPEIRVLHRHAAVGGLRAHGARVITYASSRARLTHRHLPATTEIYLSRRYFSERQVREMLWLSAFGTLSARGGAARRAAKALVSLALMPASLLQIGRSQRAARQLLSSFPRIPQLRVSP